MRAVARPIKKDDLQAWVDGRLTQEQAEAIEDYFAAHPELREQWSQYAEQRDELRAAFAGPAEQPIPARLRVARPAGPPRRAASARRADRPVQASPSAPPPS